MLKAAENTYSQLCLLNLLHCREGLSNTKITLNCCNSRCSSTYCGPWVTGTYLAMQNITVALYVWKWISIYES